VPVEKILSIGASIATALGLAAAAIGVWYQYAAYEEEAFTRRFSALALAWDIVRRANGASEDIGQSTALLYLISNQNVLVGNVTINDGRLLAFNIDGNELDLPLNDSSFCGTTFSLSRLRGARLSNSLFVDSTFMGVDIRGANASGSFFNSATLWNVTARGARFVAADLRRAKFLGGDFSDADFAGADMRGISVTPTYVDGKGPDLNGPMDRAFDEDVSNFEAQAIVQQNRWITLDPLQSQRAVTSFRDANFRLADLRGADLSEVALTQSQVDQACVDGTTVLPPGVRLKAACTPDAFIAKRREALQSGFGAPRLVGSCAIRVKDGPVP